MISGFRSKGLAELFRDGRTKWINRKYHRRLQILLDALANANHPREVPGCKPLRGQKDVFEIDVSGHWRLYFKFQNGEFCEVDFDEGLH